LPGVAHASGSLHITGTVTNQTGGGVLNVAVTATAPGGSTTLFGPSLITTNGTYQLDVDPGTYDIHFVPPEGGRLNPITSSNFVVQTDQTLSVQLTSPSHTLSGTVRNGDGQPLPSMQLNFRLTSTGSQLQVNTDANGHYSAIANAGVYYLNTVFGNVQPGDGTGIYSQLTPSAMPQFDVTTTDLTQDFQLPTTQLNLTVKDGFGAPVPNASVNINTNNVGQFALTTGPTNGYKDIYGRGGNTNSQGIATILAYKTTYPAGSICATVNGNQICNTTTGPASPTIATNRSWRLPDRGPRPRRGRQLEPDHNNHARGLRPHHHGRHHR
jgi:hypothetical protein